MSFRFIHTSDWQVGKVFQFVDVETMGVLREARLEAVTRLGEVAHQQQIDHVFVAGDVYDMETLSRRSLHQPLERMRHFDKVTWHLLPGNHDPHRANGLWESLVKEGLPNNIELYLEPQPKLLERERAAILPAPLHHKRTVHDPTEYMNDLSIPDYYSRIGLAHGSVTSFGSSDASTANYIDPKRVDEAQLSYLAMGDWHGQLKINSRCWYSGTPETDSFKSNNSGKALIVEIASARSEPVVKFVDTGKFSWFNLEETLFKAEHIKDLEEKIRSLSLRLDSVLVDLEVGGSLSLSELNRFHTQFADKLSAALRYLRIDHSQLVCNPTDDDMDHIDISGFVRNAAEELKRRSESGEPAQSRMATEALQRLYFELMRESGSSAR